jgi:hypothetical protein
LGVSRATLEAMIEAEKIEALPTGFTRMIPTREVQRAEKAPAERSCWHAALRSGPAYGLNTNGDTQRALVKRRG